MIVTLFLRNRMFNHKVLNNKNIKTIITFCNEMLCMYICKCVYLKKKEVALNQIYRFVIYH